VFTFPKKYCLSSHKSIKLLFKQNNSLFVYPFRIVWSINSIESIPNLAFLFSVPKAKIKLAVKRNRIKRCTKEAVRLNKHSFETKILELNISANIAFIYIANAVLPYNQIQKSVITIFEKLEKEFTAQKH